jgi:hypothetical protein
VAVNAGEEPATLSLGNAGSAEVLLATARGAKEPPRVEVVDGVATLDIGPRAGAVVRLG